MLLILLTISCSLLLLYIKWNFQHWQRKGFPYAPPKIPFGALDAVRRRERSLGMAIYDVYCSSQEKVLGIYLLLRPALLVRDPQLARDMLAKDFSHFHDRGVYVDEDKNPLSAALFALRGQKWKAMRHKLMPCFTSGKLKGMFGTIEDIADKLIAHMHTTLSDKGSTQVEAKKLFQTYAIDIIASVIFGLEVNSFRDPKNAFNNISSNVNDPGYTSLIRNTCQFLYPTLEKFFVFLNWQEKAPIAMRDLVRKTIEYREQHNVERKDMLQLLLQLRNTGKVNESDNIWSAESKPGADKYMSIEMIAAQLFLFYVAGYETTGSSIAFTIYELSQYPDVLRKAKQDVEQALEKHGSFTYEALHEMKYLDLCVLETIRKYPGLPILNRECTQDYRIPGTDKLIEKGTPIIISLFGMHRDAEYFPEPERYNPDRFLEEQKTYNPTAFMPFGDGPRHCIAQRMGLLNVKMALAKVLTNFTIEPHEKRQEIEFANYGVVIVVKDGIYVRLAKK